MVWKMNLNFNMEFSQDFLCMFLLISLRHIVTLFNLVILCLNIVDAFLGTIRTASIKYVLIPRLLVLDSPNDRPSSRLTGDRIR
jgi:hypothetical protein